MEGFEPSTPALRKRCSAIELHRRQNWLDSSWRSSQCQFGKKRQPKLKKEILEPRKN